MKKLVAVAIFLSASRADAEPLSLADAQAEARANAPEVGALDARVAGADLIARDRRRRLRSDPELTASYATGAAGGDADEQQAGLGLDWTVDFSGAWRDRRDAADAGRDQATASRADGLAALDEDVAVAVADLAYAQRAVARADRIVALRTIVRDAAQKTLDAAHGTQLDLDAAELDLAAASADRDEADADREQAQIALARLLGRDRHDDLDVADPVEDVAAPTETDIDQLVDADPRVVAAADAARAAGLERKAAGRATWKSLTFGLDLDYARHEIPSSAFGDAFAAARWQDVEVGVKLSFPISLFEGGRQARTDADAALSARTSEATVVRADVRAELEKAAAELRGAVKVWSSVSGTSDTIDREYDLLDKAFRAGALDVTSEAQSARRLVEAGARLDAALRDLRIAHARWLRRMTSHVAP